MILILFILGSCVGSFLNVLIDRLPSGESPFIGRSHCDYCKKTLKAADLVPVISYLYLGGRCRYCRKKLSLQYPLIEILTGILFLLTFYRLSFQGSGRLSVMLPLAIILVSGLEVIFFTDLKYRIIPDEIILTLIIAAVPYIYLSGSSPLLNHIISGLSGSSVFMFLVLATRGKGMGLGDVKFAFLMGLLLGFPQIIISMYLAFLTGALFSLILIVTGRKKMKSTIAFGPFLSGATLVTLFWGQIIWGVFARILGL